MAIYYRCCTLVLIGAVAISCTNPSDELPDVSLSGKKLYQQYCTTCHGSSGDLGVSDAADLTQSIRTKAQKIEFIANGSGDGVMQAYSASKGGNLSNQEIEKIADYIEEFVK